MKKTITINLSGTVFNIDEDAYELLKTYLERIESHFSDPAEGKEIMNDIEARIAELLSPGGQALPHPVGMKEVEEVIRIMGDPDEFAGEEDTESGTGPEKRSGRSSGGTRSGRRIYRDTDNRILGGVCSGMAAYLSVDVIWVRIIFVILALAFFSGFLVYLLLWVVIPPAVTTAQKLEMRGEPVTISNIGKAVKEEFENVRKNLKI